MKPVKIKNINVVDTDNRRLSVSTSLRADKLVKRGCALWLDEKSIKLLVNNNNRKNLKKEIVEEANRICYICNVYIASKLIPTLDHVIPKVKDGKDIKANLKCCCHRCNTDKAAMDISEYVMAMYDNPEIYPWITEDRLVYLIDTYVIDH